MSLNLGDEGAFDTGAFMIELTDDVDAEVGIKTLNLDIADQDGSVTTVDLEAANAVIVNDGENDVLLSVLDVGESSGTYYQGSITLRGDDNDVVTLGSTVTLDAADLPTAGTEGVFGAWTITTGDGGNTITGSNGIDTITSNGGDDSVLGGAGNDIIAVGNGADTIDGGEGGDSIRLLESVSSADVIEYGVVGEGSAAGAEEGTFSGFDVITGFTTLVDHIDYNVAVTDTVVVAGTVGAADLTAANYKSADAVLAFFNDADVEDDVAGAGDYEAGEDFVVAVTIAGVGTVVYEIVDATAATLAVDEISLIATVDATMVADDFL